MLTVMKGSTSKARTALAQQEQGHDLTRACQEQMQSLLLGFGGSSPFPAAIRSGHLQPRSRSSPLGCICASGLSRAKKTWREKQINLYRARRSKKQPQAAQETVNRERRGCGWWEQRAACQPSVCTNYFWHYLHRQIRFSLINSKRSRGCGGKGEAAAAESCKLATTSSKMQSGAGSNGGPSSSGDSRGDMGDSN